MFGNEIPRRQSPREAPSQLVTTFAGGSPALRFDACQSAQDAGTPVLLRPVASWLRSLQQSLQPLNLRQARALSASRSRHPASRSPLAQHGAARKTLPSAQLNPGTTGIAECLRFYKRLTQLSPPSDIKTAARSAIGPATLANCHLRLCLALYSSRSVPIPEKRTE
jgi:hypothetical protein